MKSGSRPRNAGRAVATRRNGPSSIAAIAGSAEISAELGPVKILDDEDRAAATRVRFEEPRPGKGDRRRDDPWLGALERIAGNDDAGGRREGLDRLLGFRFGEPERREDPRESVAKALFGVLGAVVEPDAAGAPEDLAERPVAGPAPVARQRPWRIAAADARSRAAARNSRTRRLLPIPAAPSTSTYRGLPSRKASSRAPSNASSSALRPTNGASNEGWPTPVRSSATVRGCSWRLSLSPGLRRHVARCLDFGSMTAELDWHSPLPPGFRWPDGVRAAACITFDVDAESAILFEHPEAAAWLDVMTHQAYGAANRHRPTAARPRSPGHPGDVLHSRATARSAGLRSAARSATPATRSPTTATSTRAPTARRRPSEEARLLRGLAALDEVLGVRPTGYRGPNWELTFDTPALLARHGFVYDSGLMDADHPYLLATSDEPGAATLVELPATGRSTTGSRTTTCRGSPARA